MALWTKLQRKYVKDIEDNLHVKFTGKPTRADADLFIKEYAEANRKFNQDANKQTRPTGKQLRFIKEIEDVLSVEFKGRTIKSASKFIKKHLMEYSSRMGSERKILRYCNRVADNIDSYQRKRKARIR